MDTADTQRELRALTEAHGELLRTRGIAALFSGTASNALLQFPGFPTVRTVGGTARAIRAR